jgi:hypothetical protein
MFYGGPDWFLYFRWGEINVPTLTLGYDIRYADPFPRTTPFPNSRLLYRSEGAEAISELLHQNFLKKVGKGFVHDGLQVSMIAEMGAA